MAWQTDCVFISSTFRDMESERDALEWRVLPRLREEFSAYEIDNLDVHLRWAVADERWPRYTYFGAPQFGDHSIKGI